MPPSISWGSGFSFRSLKQETDSHSEQIWLIIWTMMPNHQNIYTSHLWRGECWPLLGNIGNNITAYLCVCFISMIKKKVRCTFAIEKHPINLYLKKKYIVEEPTVQQRKKILMNIHQNLLFFFVFWWQNVNSKNSSLGRNVFCLSRLLYLEIWEI